MNSIIKESDIGHLARLPLCPRCSDTKDVSEFKRYPTLIGTYIRYICDKCKVSWEGLAHNFTLPNPPDHFSYIRSQYLKLHKLCPSCGYDGGSQTDWDWATTVMTISMESLETAKDMNYVCCTKCNWRGRVHDLLPIESE